MVVVYVFYVLVFQQILQGLFSLWDGFRWYSMVRRRMRTHAGFYTPNIAVICPCKGAEPGLEENLRALTQFQYASYEVYFSLATSLDPAVKLIERAKTASAHPVHIVIAGPPEKCSEKVHNLRRAVETAGEKFDAFVFVDSDIRPGRGWLGKLVAPLGNSNVGAATSYRWLIPSPSMGRSTFWSALASAWNAAVATLLGRPRTNFCWGGGVAIRRQTFEKAGVMEAWEGALSDDWAMTSALDAAGLEIEFVAECLAPTLYGCTSKEFFDFTDRQMLITRVYAQRMWIRAILAHLSYSVTVTYAIAVIIFLLIDGDPWGQLFPLLAIIPLLAAVKGALRVAAVADALPEWKAKVSEWAWAWIVLAPLVSFFFVSNAAATLATRRVRWRGILYEILSPNDTRILTR